jgi:four helix bundle protein
MPEGTIKSYTDLIGWQKGVDLVDVIYQETGKFPQEELYGLTHQIRHAAVTVPASVAEGWGRDSTKNQVPFLKISRGSLFEPETLPIISFNRKYSTESALHLVMLSIHELRKMLNSMITKWNGYVNET